MNGKERFLFYNLLTGKEKESLKIKIYEKGEILTYFENIDKFHFILDGKVRLFQNLDKMTLSSVSILSEGYLVGILRFLMGQASTHEAVVLTDILKVIEINPDIIKRLKNESIEFNSHLLEVVIKRGMETVEPLRIRSFSGVKGLIAYNIIKHSKNGYIYTKNFDEIIKYLNISRNGFYSTLKKFIKDKSIEKSKNSVKILDHKKLKALYEDFLN